jgi:flagellar hook-associated protein 3 FlgL
MRVTHLGNYLASLQRITSNASAAGAAQDRLASGKRFTRASEDPTGMSRALELRASLEAREQETRNAADGLMWVNLADAKLQSAVDQLQRLKELAVRGATFTNADERAAIASEAAHIRSSIVELANSRHQGRGLFAGFSTEDAVHTVGGVWTYGGDSGAVNRRIGDKEVVAVNVTADDVFGFTSGRDLFSVIDDFEAALLANDTAAIDTGIAEFETAIHTVLDGLTSLGAVGSRIEAAQARILEDRATIGAQLSEIEDVDLAEAAVELKMTGTAYEAALAAFAQSTSASLLDFLR